MAVTNFHYITRMSSGFKVYILEGNYSFLLYYNFQLARKVYKKVHANKTVFFCSRHGILIQYYFIFKQLS